MQPSNHLATPLLTFYDRIFTIKANPPRVGIAFIRRAVKCFAVDPLKNLKYYSSKYIYE